ncbi:MAG: TetR/AcrR family transcriptional regulator [Reyranella sp.]|nr:MAG: TetR/AcrR family transcriptional regulator [Reyranella sp.]TBR29704.1 MAG: TetR/AcrR family transcriptional regulator [Reyranella sp.]
MDTDRSVNRNSAASPRVRRPEDRAAEIARAALELFVTRGFAATKLEDVARQASVSKGLPYLYFKNKEELFKAVIAEAIAGPLAQANDVIDRFEGTSEELLRALVAGFRAFEETPAGGVVKLILAEAGNFPDVAKFYCTHFDVRGRDLFIRTLRRGVESGEFRPLPDLETTAIVILQPLAMFSVWKRSLAPFDPSEVDGDRFYTAYLDFVLKGLRP